MTIMSAKFLDYSIKILEDNDITDIILFANTNRELYQEYIDQIRANKFKTQKLNIQLLYLPTVVTFGDALREIKRQHVIKNDFVL
jgi:predicted adenine nucleotide alpha hydrolase (AANH) superfamily ATPase